MPNDLALAEAVLGRDAEEFLKGEIGRYVIGRCEQERDEALCLLAVVSPWRRNRIRQLQAQVWRAESLKGWLVDLVTAGRQAEAVLAEDE